MSGEHGRKLCHVAMKEMDKQPFRWTASVLQVLVVQLQQDCKWTATAHGPTEDCKWIATALWFSYKKPASGLLQRCKCKLLLQPA